MEAGGRLVQNIDRLPRRPAGELRRQLDPLGLASGQLRRGLAELNIGKTHIVQGLDLPADRRNITEEVQRLLHGHIQHIIDILSLIIDLQRLTVIALPAADLAGYIYVRKEMHLHLQDPVAGTGLAPSALHIKGKPALGIALRLCVRRRRKKITDQIEHAGIGRRIRPGRPSDRALVDIDHLIELLQTQDLVMVSGHTSRVV